MICWPLITLFHITFVCHWLATNCILTVWLHRFFSLSFQRNLKCVWECVVWLHEFALFGVLFSPCLCNESSINTHWIYEERSDVSTHICKVLSYLLLTFCSVFILQSLLNYKKCMHKYTCDSYSLFLRVNYFLNEFHWACKQQQQRWRRHTFLLRAG